MRASEPEHGGGVKPGVPPGAGAAGSGNQVEEARVFNRAASSSGDFAERAWSFTLTFGASEHGAPTGNHFKAEHPVRRRFTVRDMKLPRDDLAKLI